MTQPWLTPGNLFKTRLESPAQAQYLALITSVEPNGQSFEGLRLQLAGNMVISPLSYFMEEVFIAESVYIPVEGEEKTYYLNLIQTEVDRRVETLEEALNTWVGYSVQVALAIAITRKAQ